MKKFLFLMTITASLMLTAAEERSFPFSIDPKLPRRISIGKAGITELARDGAVRFEIVVPQDASASAKFAGTEMAEQLGKVFGAKLAVLPEATGKVPAIIIGDAKLAEKLGIKPETFDRDGFVIRTDGGNVLIIGRDDPKKDPRRSILESGLKGECATLFGVYDFLERFAGIRYYFPGNTGTVIPRLKNWSLPEINIYDRPDFAQRRFNDYNHGGRPIHYYTGADWKKNAAINKLRNRHETLYIPNCHGLAYLGFFQRFGKSHPEYFALDAGGKRIIAKDEQFDRSQICFSSKIKDEIIADAEAFLTGKPASERGVCDRNGKIGWVWSVFPAGMPCFNIMPNDACYPCRCPECWKHFSQPEQQQSDFIWKFFVDICQAMKDRKVPGYLTTMAYANYRNIPNLDIPDNLLVMLAIRGPWNENNPALRDADLQLLRDWRDKLGNKTWLWTYPGKYYGMFPGIPHTTPRALSSFIKRAQPYIFGLYIECESDRLIHNYLTYHVFGKLAWNPDTDVEKLLAEHVEIMYGPGAVPMKDFFDTIERHWMKIASKVVETSAGPKTVYPSEQVLWNEIYSPSELKRLDGLFNEAEKRCANSPEHLARVKFIRQEMFGPLLAESKKYGDANNAVKHWQTYLPETVQPIQIDGRIDDPAWKNAAVFQLSPLNGASAEVKTLVRALRDKDNFYFAFECEEPETPAAVTRNLDSPELWKDADVEIFLSPDGDRERYYQLMINARGSLTDLQKRGVDDFSWNSGAEVKTQVTPGKGWTTEVRLPRASMAEALPDGILAEFSRHRAVEGKKVKTPYYCWSPFARSFGDLQRFGKLTFQPVQSANLVDEPDFAAPVRQKRWLGQWWTSDPFLRDETTFVSKGASARLAGPDKNYTQYVPMKPDTEYVLSFFLRMDQVKKLDSKWSGFYVRMDDGSGKPQFFPAYPIQLDGSMPWQRMECRFRSSPNTGSKSKPYLQFALRHAGGTAWIDHIELTPVK